MERGGFDYNNFMLQRWVIPNDEEHRVIDDFERNKILIDFPITIQMKLKQALEMYLLNPNKDKGTKCWYIL